MHRHLRAIGAVTLIAAALVPAATAGAAGMQDHGFYAAGFGVCWYGDDRPDDYFGLNVQCPLAPMPGDSTYDPGS